jgi:hypothetical protein
MSFQHFYGPTPRLQESTLATIPESAYSPKPVPVVEEMASPVR